MKKLFSFSVIILFLSVSFRLFAIEPDDMKKLGDSLLVEQFKVCTSVSPLADSIISFGKKFLNIPYHRGSSKEGVSGFDCSGFTSFVYSKFGFNLIHSSAAQARQFPNVKKKDILPGDLVFYSGRGRRSGVGHVGLVTEIHPNGDFDFIHATNGAGVTISKSTEAYYVRRYRTAARVLSHDSLEVKPIAQPVAVPEKHVEVVAAVNIPQPEPVRFHEVKKGDTLYSLARQYGVSVSQLKMQNGLRDNLIKINQQLKIR